MNDALTEVADISLQLQRKEMTLPTAHNLLCHQVRVLSSIASGQHGPYTKMTLQAVDDSQFQEIPVHQGRKCDVNIRPGQFFSSLSADIEKRIFTIRPKNKDTTAVEKEQQYELFIGSMKCQ